jgi:hypothetical protein
MFYFLTKNNIIVNSMININGVPPNSSRDLKVGPERNNIKRRKLEHAP